MAIDTRQKRQAAASFGRLAPAVLPTGTSTALERAASLSSYILLAQTIQLSPIVRNRTLGAPTIIQAATSTDYTVFVDGVDRSSYWDVTQAVQIRQQVNSRATLTMRFVDVSGGGWTPTEGQTVLFYEGTSLLFRGSITRLQEERLIKTPYPRVVATCGDVGVTLANRVVNAFYSQDLWGSAYFIVPDLIAQHAADLGISYVRDANDNDLQLIGDQLFYGLTFAEAMNQLAKQMNADWTVDVNNNLYFIFLGSAAVNGNAFTDSSANWLEVKATRTVALEGNRVWAKSSAQLLQTQTDTFPGDPVGIYTMKYPPRDQSLIPVVKENGTAKVVVTLLDAIGGATYDYFRVGTVVQKNLSATPLSSSDTVTITYPSPVPYMAMAEDATDIAANGLKEIILECGNITSKTTLQAIADAWLARLKERAVQLTINSGSKIEGSTLAHASRDWQPGQKISVNFGASGGATPVVDDFLVDSLDTQIRDGMVSFQTLTLSNTQYQRTANPAKFLQDLIARLRTQVPLSTQVLTLSQDTDLGSGYQLNVDQQINLDTTNGPFTVTMPPASEMYGKQISWMKISSDANLATIQGATVGGRQQTLNGATSQTLSQQYQAAITEGNQWQ